MPHTHFYLKKETGKKDFFNFNPILYYSGFVCDEPKWTVSRHAHTFCEIIYICEGGGLFIINGMEYHATQGDIIIYNNGEYHEEFSDPDHPLKTYFYGIGNNNERHDDYINKIKKENRINQFAANKDASNITHHDNNELVLENRNIANSFNDIDSDIDKDIANNTVDNDWNIINSNADVDKDDFCPLQFLSHMQSPVIHSGIYSEVFEKYIIELVHESSMKSFGFNTICSNILSSMFVIIRRILISEENNESTQINRKSLVSNNIIEYIKSNRNQSLSVNDIAKHFYISKDYLAHIFKSETGISPINYLLMLKIDEAKRLLSTTDKTISEISALIGYDDANYVSQLFKKMTGVSPTQFRLSSKKD